MTKRIQTQLLTCAATVAAILLAGVASAQAPAATAPPTSMQTTLANDVGNLSDKFTGLARVMAGKDHWRPGAGVRSVGEVFNLIVNENRMLNNLLSGAPNQGRGGMGGGTAIADAAELQAALKTTYSALRDTIAGMSDADLSAATKIFGRETTKQGATLMVLLDQHEHLGQSIAYARSNSVVPPWSK